MWIWMWMRSVSIEEHVIFTWKGVLSGSREHSWYLVGPHAQPAGSLVSSHEMFVFLMPISSPCTFL